MHVRWNSTGDVVSADEDEGAAEDDCLEFDKGRGKHPRFREPVCTGTN